MLDIIELVMIYAGSALMVYNIYLYMTYEKRLREQGGWEKEQRILVLPTILLIAFLVGYLAVGLFGTPDLVIAGILLGGSIFVYLMIVFLQRVSDRIKEHERMSAELIAAQKTNLSKNSFLSTISHEVRTPLNAIIGYADLLLKERGLSASARDKASKIDDSAEHLLAVLNDVLDMSNLEARSETLEDAKFSLQQTFDELNEEYGKRCAAKGLEYNASVIGELSPCYRGDKEKIQQVLGNVLDNAVKFTDAPGYVKCTAQQVAEYEGRCAMRFVISDSGIGIGDDYLPKLFDPFTREDRSRTNRYEGTGLGLAIVKNIVDMMNGDITVASEKGRGTTIKISLTLLACTQGEAESLGAEDEEAAPAAPETEGTTAGACAPGSSAQVSDGETALQDDGVHEGVGEDALDAELVTDSVDAGITVEEQAEAAYDDGLEWGGVLEGRRILLVEDIDLNADIIMDLLDLAGMESDHAKNGQIGLDMFAESEPGYYDAVLMDVRMPVMDGLQSASAIRALKRADAQNVPIVALTANAFDEDYQRSLQAGMNAHLVKPIDADLLYETLEKLMLKASEAS